MKKNIQTKSYNFLLEMLIVIVLFTFCSIIFVQLFALSSQKSKQADIMADVCNDVEYYASMIKNNQPIELRQVSDNYTIEISPVQQDYKIQAYDNQGNCLISVMVGSSED